MAEFENREISLNGHKVSYKIAYSKRRSIQIRVYPHKEVIVSAPLRARKGGVEKFLQQKAAWIINNLNKHDNNIRITAPKDFTDGEIIYYLGKKYELVIKRDVLSAVELIGDVMVLSTPYIKSAVKIKALIKNWYKIQTINIFNERLEECLKLTAVIGINKATSITPRKMNKRWGTCTSDNKIILNSNLIYMDVQYIDYVILHELCHFKEKNHSPKYYALLAAVCPGYKAVRRDMNRHIVETF